MDRWIAIACFDDGEWQAFAKAAGLEALTRDPRFATLDARLRNQDALDAAVNGWTMTQDAFQCMYALQSAGVPAGVCHHHVLGEWLGFSDSEIQQLAHEGVI